MFGYCGRMLWVDLESRKFVERPLDKKDAEQFIGGAGLAAKIHYTMKSFDVDPLSAKNPLILMIGPITATAVKRSRFHCGDRSCRGKSCEVRMCSGRL